jgi:NAD(P)H-hydrate epimerase
MELSQILVDANVAAALLPPRPEKSSKWDFGRALLAVGSRRYRGSAYLCASAALRCGAGYIEIFGDEALLNRMISTLPEIIYHGTNPFEKLTDVDISEFLKLSKSSSAILVGCGCGESAGLEKMIESLLVTSGTPLVLDADALNVMSKKIVLKKRLILAKRKVILTPHLIEMSRLSGLSVEEIERDRVGVAVRFAREWKCILVLKGSGTVITDGESVFVNTSGSSALAKAGSGDTLAGAVVSFIAAGSDPVSASVLAVYLHGAAGDSLSERYSEYGVTPSDLPAAIAKEITKLCEIKENQFN